MKFHRFFIEQKIQGSSITITNGALLHQWVHVLHLEKNEEVALFDGSGLEHCARIELLDKNQAQLSVVSSQDPGTEPVIKITLYQALIKKDNFFLVLQKGTEVGVSAFTPVLASRSEKKAFNAERGRKIIQEAAEQSGRVKLPALYEVASLQDALRQAPKPIVFLHAGVHPHPPTIVGGLSPQGRGELFPLPLRERVRVRGSLSLFVGPEGGWTPEEVALAKEAGATIVSLGPRTLRAETAGPLAAGIILATME